MYHCFPQMPAADAHIQWAKRQWGKLKSIAMWLDHTIEYTRDRIVQFTSSLPRGREGRACSLESAAGWQSLLNSPALLPYYAGREGGGAGSLASNSSSLFQSTTVTGHGSWDSLCIQTRVNSEWLVPCGQTRPRMEWSPDIFISRFQIYIHHKL